MPSYIIYTTPAPYAPVNKEMWIESDDPLSGSTNFKYLYKVNKIDPITNVATPLGTYKVPPRPVNSRGLFTPHKILRSQTSYNLQPYIRNITNALNSIVKYNYSYGYEYSLAANYTAANATGVFAGKLAMSLSTTQSNPFIVGDTIIIDKTNKQSNPQYDGTASVLLSFFGPVFGITLSFIITDQTYVTSSVNDDGQITFLSRYIGTQSSAWAYNGTRQYDEINYDFSNKYLIDGSSDERSYLTEFGYDYSFQTLPSVADMEKYGKEIYRYQFETLSFIQDEPFANIQYSVGAFSATGSLLTTGFISTTSSTNIAYRRFDLPIGTANLFLNGIFSSASNIKYYLIQCYYSGVAKMTKFYKIVDDCSPYPTNFRLAFLNRAGGFDYWNFNWKSTNTVTTNRTDFRKVLAFNYKIGDRQDSILAQKANETWNISTDWITPKDSEKFKQLITSPEVYIVPDPWEFYDNYFFNGGRLGFVSKYPHYFKVNDVITIKQFPGFTYPQYNSTFRIVAVPDEYSVVLDDSFLGSTSAQGGIAYFADQRTYPILITDTSYQVKTAIDNKLFSFAITFKFAYDINLQNN